MNDPYSVLGVPSTATDEEIKKAYRDLARKYHPDNYVDNPLADLAQEKMKEINEAYDTVTKMRAGGGSSSGYTGTSSSSSYSAGNPQYNEIRTAINMGDLRRAEQLLAAAQSRDAEWNFLMGSLNYKKGWLDEAYSYFQRAVSMNPNNYEYQQALRMVQSGGVPYRSAGYGSPAVNGGMDLCDICTAMWCMNLLCRCG